MKTRHDVFAFFSIFLLLVFQSLPAYAQYADDALRFSSIGFGVGSRAIGMGGAYIGVADDYSAVFWNPAGLAQMRRLEFTGGIVNSSYKNDASFIGVTTNGKSSGTALDNLGFVFPFPTVQGSLVFALGYNRVTDFTSALSFNGFNDKSSILPSLYDSELKYDIPFWVGLEDTVGQINVKKNVNQQGEVREGGSIGNWAFGGAIDVEKNLSFGLTINVMSGTYTYVRNFVEEDTKNNYSDPRLSVPIDDAYLKFKKFYYDSNVSSEITGVNAKFGMMYRFEDIARVGATIRTPSAIVVHETFTDEGTSVFDDGYVPTFQGKTYNHHLNDSYNDYGVQTPWVLGLGGSYSPIDGLLLAADVEYTDWTQIAWIDNADLQKENISLKKNFRPTMNLAVGGEYEIPGTDFRVRGGYAYKPSAFEGDPSSYNQKIMTAGAGVLLQNNVMFDVGAAVGSMKTFHNNYGSKAMSLSRTNETISTTHIAFTVSYRF
jgi:long-subunit fatty acid transport protein